MVINMKKKSTNVTLELDSTVAKYFEKYCMNNHDMNTEKYLNNLIDKLSYDEKLKQFNEKYKDLFDSLECNYEFMDMPIAKMSNGDIVSTVEYPIGESFLDFLKKYKGQTFYIYLRGCDLPHYFRGKIKESVLTIA